VLQHVKDSVDKDKLLFVNDDDNCRRLVCWIVTSVSEERRLTIYQAVHLNITEASNIYRVPERIGRLGKSLLDLASTVILRSESRGSIFFSLTTLEVVERYR
jgi:hypothetical protein